MTSSPFLQVLVCSKRLDTIESTRLYNARHSPNDATVVHRCPIHRMQRMLPFKVVRLGKNTQLLCRCPDCDFILTVR